MMETSPVQTMSTGSPSKSKSKVLDPSTSGNTLPSPQHIYIRVRRDLVQLPQSTNSPPLTPPPPTPTHLYLIEGSTQEIGLYAGGDVCWVIKIAHLICAPLGRGVMYTHATGTANEWFDREKDATWREVLSTDPLLPGIYQFEMDSPFSISRLSHRTVKSITTAGSESNATTLRNRLIRRDGGKCALSGVADDLIASHLIPKRMADEGVWDVMRRFVGNGEEIGIDKFHPKIALLLFVSLDKKIDLFLVGLYHISDNTYQLHNFTADQNVSVFGFTLPPDNHGVNPDRLHGFTKTLTHHYEVDLPPPGVFNWHYLQCVCRRFATKEYRDLTGIYYHVYPFKTEDDEDSSSEWGSNVDPSSPPWPTYNFDRFMRMQGEKLAAEERNSLISSWAQEVEMSN